MLNLLNPEIIETTETFKEDFESVGVPLAKMTTDQRYELSMALFDISTEALRQLFDQADDYGLTIDQRYFIADELQYRREWGIKCQ